MTDTKLTEGETLSMLLGATLRNYTPEPTPISRGAEVPVEAEPRGEGEWMVRVFIKEAERWHEIGKLTRTDAHTFEFRARHNDDVVVISADTIEEATEDVRKHTQIRKGKQQCVGDTAILRLLVDHATNVNALACDAGGLAAYATGLAFLWGKLMVEDVQPGQLAAHVEAFTNLAVSAGKKLLANRQRDTLLEELASMVAKAITEKTDESNEEEAKPLAH